MTDGLVEAVAKALAKRHGFGDKSPYIADAQAALAAIKASGFAVVPVEVLRELAHRHWTGGHPINDADDRDMDDLWDALNPMIAAAGEGQ